MHFIKTVTNFLTQDECKSIISKYSKEKLKVAEIGSNKEGDELKKIRDSKVFFTNIDWLELKIQNYLISEIKIKGYELDSIEAFQFTEYKDGGHYDWHTDVGMGYKDRFCSVVIQLNDEYNGADLMYKDENNEIQIFKRGLGSMFIFNSGIEHKVSNIIDGVRYSLVTWIKLKEIEQFKKTLL
jgi:predicted 2-oxoglutarate/Fe(II)-dependent dioxygenase YbiX